MNVFGGQKTTLDIVCQVPPTFFFDTRPPSDLELIKDARLAGQQASGNLFPFQSWDYIHIDPPCLPFKFFLLVSVG